MSDKLQFFAWFRHLSTAESPDKLKSVGHFWIRQQYPALRRDAIIGEWALHRQDGIFGTDNGAAEKRRAPIVHCKLFSKLLWGALALLIPSP
jgi:hypothetical protein